MDHVAQLLVHTSETDDHDNKKEEEEEEVVLPGFRFHPTDAELVGFYLKRKVDKKPLRFDLIKQLDIYKYDPWDLPKVNSSMGEKEWFFFCKRGRKYKNSVRPNRVTKSGFWKATGIDKVIYGTSVKDPHHQTQSVIGLKKSLVYYCGSAGKGTKTDWMMHEFRLPHNASNDVQEAEVWTLCRIFKRIPSAYKKYISPNFKDSAASDSKSNPEISVESDNWKQVDEMKPIIIGHDFDKRKHELLLGQFGSVAHLDLEVPSTLSSWNQNHVVVEDTVLSANHNWDDLRSVVQFAIDPPSTVYDNFSETYIPPYFS